MAKLVGSSTATKALSSSRQQHSLLQPYRGFTLPGPPEGHTAGLRRRSQCPPAQASRQAHVRRQRWLQSEGENSRPALAPHATTPPLTTGLQPGQDLDKGRSSLTVPSTPARSSLSATRRRRRHRRAAPPYAPAGLPPCCR
ncbi:hypothetical protein NDU88_000779 [Pleurodeles waltl]|uniref:Uncharacterized protein n=1 Tax=Pleurodeles waltl TaxID=8319 RepID=A0AAV7Q519_PLEWA|nr:hypothetical protein NDU88_000779 [Pleurodeles waltl]